MWYGANIGCSGGPVGIGYRCMGKSSSLLAISVIDGGGPLGSLEKRRLAGRDGGSLGSMEVSPGAVLESRRRSEDHSVSSRARFGGGREGRPSLCRCCGTVDWKGWLSGSSEERKAME